MIHQDYRQETRPETTKGRELEAVCSNYGKGRGSHYAGRTHYPDVKTIAIAPTYKYTSIISTDIRGT